MEASLIRTVVLIVMIVGLLWLKKNRPVAEEVAAQPLVPEPASKQEKRLPARNWQSLVACGQ